MMRKTAVIAGLFVAGLLALPSQAEVEPQDEAKPAASQMSLAARNALKAARALYEVGKVTLDDVYLWSRRVVESDKFAPQAVAEHLALMRELHARAVALGKAGAAGGDPLTLHATAFYVAEAEFFAGP
jgi:hypothetical protein